MSEQKILYIGRGRPGSGKSTIGAVLAGSHCISADDYPGIYTPKGYQIHLQAKAHDWCRQSVEDWMKEGVTPIFIANTNTRLAYVDSWTKMAAEYGYSATLVHVETTILPDGTESVSTHNVDAGIVERMAQQIEPWYAPPTSISHAQAIEFLTISKWPSLLVIDLDGTLRTTASGKTFPEDPKDQKLIEGTVKAIDHLLIKSPATPIVVATNQRGIANGRKSMEFLLEEISGLRGLIADALEQAVNAIYVATHENDVKGLTFSMGRHVFGTFPSRADKPGPGMLLKAIDDFLPFCEGHTVWYVGDSHNSRCADDWLAARAAQNLRPCTLHYIPVEVFQMLPHLTAGELF